MRIAGGQYQGRIFNPDKKFSARPTTDLAKEGLFNILENRYDFSGKTALDLFSGTGSIAYEFVSRGCSKVLLVEKDVHHYHFIREVLSTLKITNAQVFRTDVFRFLLHCREPFDFVFADPPYDFPFFAEVPQAVFKAGVIKKGGLFILEHPKEFNFSELSGFQENRKYGKVNFSFFEG